MKSNRFAFSAALDTARKYHKEKKYAEALAALEKAGIADKLQDAPFIVNKYIIEINLYNERFAIAEALLAQVEKSVSAKEKDDFYLTYVRMYDLRYAATKNSSYLDQQFFYLEKVQDKSSKYNCMRYSTYYAHTQQWSELQAMLVKLSKDFPGDPHVEKHVATMSGIQSRHSGKESSLQKKVLPKVVDMNDPQTIKDYSLLRNLIEAGRKDEIQIDKIPQPESDKKADYSNYFFVLDTFNQSEKLDEAFKEFVDKFPTQWTTIINFAVMKSKAGESEEAAKILLNVLSQWEKFQALAPSVSKEERELFLPTTHNRVTAYRTLMIHYRNVNDIASMEKYFKLASKENIDDDIIHSIHVKGSTSFKTQNDVYNENMKKNPSRFDRLHGKAPEQISNVNVLKEKIFPDDELSKLAASMPMLAKTTKTLAPASTAISRYESGLSLTSTPAKKISAITPAPKIAVKPQLPSIPVVTKVTQLSKAPQIATPKLVTSSTKSTSGSVSVAQKAPVSSAKVVTEALLSSTTSSRVSNLHEAKSLKRIMKKQKQEQEQQQREQQAAIPVVTVVPEVPQAPSAPVVAKNRCTLFAKAAVGAAITAGVAALTYSLSNSA